MDITVPFVFPGEGMVIFGETIKPDTPSVKDMYYDWRSMAMKPLKLEDV
jgi:hypothetical protein